jgi:hypothetical protein
LISKSTVRLLDMPEREAKGTEDHPYGGVSTLPTWMYVVLQQEKRNLTKE